MAILLTVDFGHGIYKNSIEKKQVESVIENIKEKQIHQLPQRPERFRNKDIKTLEEKDQYSIELEALGVKLKMINEATWEGIFKICFLWAFVLFSIIIYKKTLSK